MLMLPYTIWESDWLCIYEKIDSYVNVTIYNLGIRLAVMLLDTI